MEWKAGRKAKRKDQKEAAVERTDQMEGRKAKEWRSDTWKKKGRNRRRKDGQREEENQRRIRNSGNGKKEEIDWVRSWFGECNNQTGSNRWQSTYMMCLSKGEG